MSSSAAAIARTAADLISGDRAVQYGDARTCLQSIAELWNALLVVKYRATPDKPELTALDVANMLEAMKIARRYAGAHNPDNYIDGVGYAALAGAIADSTNPK